MHRRVGNRCRNLPRQRRFGAVGYGGEGGFVVDGEVGEDFSVKGDFGFCQAAD